MSGDVFGNGMLLSPTSGSSRRSTTAVFLDPTPADPAPLLVERRRLFDLPGPRGGLRQDLLSAVAGSRPRTAKAIPISAQVRDALGMPGRHLLSPPSVHDPAGAG
jgi:glutamate dehydrogenase